MTGHRVLSSAEARLRVVPWRGDATTAYLTPSRGRPDARAIVRTLGRLTDEGYQAALTAALAPTDQRPFLEAGFVVHERLHLLVRSLEAIPPLTGDHAIRRARRADRPGVIAVDHSAFPTFWRLDEPGLDDALAATPSARLRVAGDPADDARLIGYSVTGRAGPRGYLQRLAVDPAAQGRGLGTALVVDGLRWLRRWGTKEVLVNTQEANGRAVRLYERLGFRLQPEGLAVLRRSLAEAS